LLKSSVHKFLFPLGSRMRVPLVAQPPESIKAVASACASRARLVVRLDVWLPDAEPSGTAVGSAMFRLFGDEGEQIYGNLQRSRSDGYR
jgi:hypothetical protein